jgi:fructose-bisphosphate aldolase, class II
MRADLAEVLRAVAPGAAGSFNILDLDMAHAVLAAAAGANAPVIVGVAARHFAAIDAPTLTPSLQAAIEQAPVPAALHLDHTSPGQMDMIRAALDLGFTGIMIDGSHLPFEQNVEITAQVVELAHRYGAGVEGELGGIAGEEGVADTGRHAPEDTPCTDPDEAVRFIGLTGVDALAIAVGTAHGIYAQAPRISFRTISAIAARTPTPLVLHGATGVPDADMRECIALGVRKVNYFSGLLKIAMDQVRAHSARSDNDFLGFKQALAGAWLEAVDEQIVLYRRFG